MFLLLVVIYGLSLGMVFLAYFFYPLVMFLIGKVGAKHGEVGRVSDGGDGAAGVLVDEEETGGSVSEARRLTSERQMLGVSDNDLPSLTIVVAAHNEQKNIAATIKSLLAQDYPAGKLKIVVFSDGSRDATVKIVKRFAAQGVKLLEFKKNLGKTECQNRAVLGVQTDLVGFADGNVRWRPLAARFLAETFVDPKVGVASGRLVLTKKGATENGAMENQDEGLFRKVDDAVKKGESLLGRVVGAVGPIYMLRTREYIRLGPAMVSDLVLPVLLAALGKKIVYEPRAVALEEASASVWIEYQRQVRMLTQGLAALPTLWRATTSLKNCLLFIMLLGHKYSRWFSVEFIILALLANVVLVAFFSTTLFGVLLAVTLLFMGLAAVGLAWEARSSAPALLRPLNYFALLNVASLMGLINFLRGRRAATWETKRS